MAEEIRGDDGSMADADEFIAPEQEGSRLGCEAYAAAERGDEAEVERLRGRIREVLGHRPFALEEALDFLDAMATAGRDAARATAAGG